MVFAQMLAALSTFRRKFSPSAHSRALPFSGKKKHFASKMPTSVRGRVNRKASGPVGDHLPVEPVESVGPVLLLGEADQFLPADCGSADV